MKEANLPKDYFISQKRFGNDIKRQKSFLLEKEYIKGLFHDRSSSWYSRAHWPERAEREC